MHVFGLCLGASTGATGVIWNLANATCRKVLEIPLEWEWDNEVCYYPLQKIDVVISRAREIAATSGATALATWGADVVLTDPVNRPIARPIHYPSASPDTLRRATDGMGMDPYQIHQISGFAPYAPYMPYALMQIYSETVPGAVRDAAQVILMPDWLTWRLTGVEVGAEGMRQSMGLLQGGSKQLYECFGIDGRIAMWPTSPSYIGIPSIGRGSPVLPFEHDTPLCLEAVGTAAENPLVLWSGTHTGCGRRLAVSAPPLFGPDTFAIGINNEGCGPNRIANTNATGLGEQYGTIVKVHLGGYADASKALLASDYLTGDDQSELLDDLPTNPGEAAKGLIARCDGDPVRAAAAIVNTTAYRCRRIVAQNAICFGLRIPTTVAGGGGWMNNPAFLHVMENVFGIWLVVPPFAADGTMAALLAHAAVAAGAFPDFPTALQSLPPLAGGIKFLGAVALF